MLTLLPLPLIVQCCGTPQNADKDFLSLTKFMRLGPFNSDSYCDATVTAMTKHSLYNFSSNKEAGLKA